MSKLIKHLDDISWFDLDKYEGERELNIGEWLSHFLIRDLQERLLEVVPDRYADIHKQALSEDILKEPISCGSESDSSVVNNEFQRLKEHPFKICDNEYFEGLGSIKELSIEESINYIDFVASCVSLVEGKVSNKAALDERFTQSARIRRSKEAIEVINNKQARLLIDLKFSDQQLIEGFTVWLKNKRHLNNDEDQGKPQLIEKAKSSSYRILAYYDLLLWQKVSGKTITKQLIVDLLYPNQTRTRDYIGKTIHPLFEQIKSDFSANGFNRFMP